MRMHQQLPVPDRELNGAGAWLVSVLRLCIGVGVNLDKCVARAFSFSESADHPIPLTRFVSLFRCHIAENSWSVGPIRRYFIFDQLRVIGDVVFDELDAITARQVPKQLAKWTEGFSLRERPAQPRARVLKLQERAKDLSASTLAGIDLKILSPCEQLLEDSSQKVIQAKGASEKNGGRSHLARTPHDHSAKWLRRVVR